MTPPSTPPKNFRPEPYTYHQEIELEIDTLSNLGHGIGRHHGWVVFVPFTLPGEHIRARIWRNEHNCSHADLVEILQPSPQRVEPHCPLFGECGGCQYQHLAYDQQLTWKQQQVAEILRLQAKLDLPIEAPVPSPRQWGYRSKLTPHFKKPRNGQIGPIGFLTARGRQQIIDVPHCPIATDAINHALPAERQRIKQSASTFKKGATLLLRAHETGVATNPREVVRQSVGQLHFDLLAGDFFQNNSYILPQLVDYVALTAKENCRYLIDAYCGSGLFGISLSQHFQQVIGVEVSPSGADWARHNVRLNQLQNIDILTADASEIFAHISLPPSETCVLIDPPRKGCDQNFLTQLSTYQPARIVYISCNPATQIRDLGILSQAGYTVTKVQPFDLFPQTRHLECVATLKRTTETSEKHDTPH